MDISIRVKGHLDQSWQSWLEDLQILHESDGTTMLTGTLPDQPALYGILNKLNHLSLTLLFLQSSEPMERGKTEYLDHDRLDRYKKEKKEQTERNTGKITTSFSMSLDGFVAGPEVALSEVEALAHDLESYHLFHAIRGAFLLELGRREEAQAAEMQALTLTGNQAEQSLLRQRLS